MNESSITASKALFARYHFHRSPGCTPTTDPTKSDPLVANGTEASATVAEASAPGVETAPGSDRPSERRRGSAQVGSEGLPSTGFSKFVENQKKQSQRAPWHADQSCSFERRNIVICLTQPYCSLGILRLATMATISISYTTPRLDRWQKGVFRLSDMDQFLQQNVNGKEMQRDCSF